MTDLLEPPASPASPATDADPAGEGTPIAKLAVLAGLIALAGLFGGLSMVVVILSIVVMIFLHELGHYLAARWSGMKVTEFFIGFGPRIWSFRRGETEYGLKVVPAGAYVRVIGMNSLDNDHDPTEESRTYRQGSFPRRFILAIAGSTMHFAQALVALFLVFAVVGVPADLLLDRSELEALGEPPTVVEQVFPDTAAAAAGLQPGDTIVALDGVEHGLFREFAEAIQAKPGEAAVVTILRDGTRVDVDVVLGVVETDDGAEVGSLGISRVAFDYPLATEGVVDAASRSIEGFTTNSTEIFGFLGRFFSFSGLSDFGDTLSRASTSNDTVGSVTSGNAQAIEEAGERPISLIGAVRLGADITDEGLWGFLLFYASLNVTIGIINLLPFPPLDGGHVMVAVYERIREGRSKRRHIVDYARVIPVAYAMFLVLGLVFLTTAYLDILDAV